MKKIDQKTFLGVLAVGAIVLLAVYFLVFQKYNDKAESLQRSNSQLRAQVQEAKKYYDTMERNKELIDGIKTFLSVMMDEYPADAREEDAVMLAVDMDAICGEEFQYSEININPSEVIYTIPWEEVQTAGVESLTGTIEFVERQVSYSGKLDYSDLKRCIQQIYSNPNRIGIYNVAIMKEESALENGDVVSYLKGNVDVAFYSVKGTDKTYVAPDIAEYIGSTTNPFQLVKSGRAGAAPAAAGE